jgi:hypothetical protein
MKCISGVLGIAVLASGSGAHAGHLTKDTAPDAISRDILTAPLARIDQGARGGDSASRIHRNFSTIIDQNFAALDSKGMEALVDGLSEAELSDLAQLYVNATSDNGQQPKLLSVMANRLSAGHLVRVSRHFGFAAVYAAVTNVASAKAADFLAHANTADTGPTPGALRFGPNGRFAPAKARALLQAKYRRDTDTPQYLNAVYRENGLGSARPKLQTVQLGKFLNLTPYEVYLDFRTAPVGALGVTGALYETSVILSQTMAGSYATGYAIGTYCVDPLIQTYAPDLWDAIGGTVNQIVEDFTSAYQSSAIALGAAEQHFAPSYSPTSFQISSFATYGGDYGATMDWAQFA